MTKLRLALEYDGAEFAGWARQPDRRTVEGVLRDALERVFPAWDDLAVAGRTDAGVHASAQVVSVGVQGGPAPEHAAEALNRRLPTDVSVRESEEVEEGFNARFSAMARAYRYRMVNAHTRPALDRRALWHPRPIDVRRLRTSAAVLVGRHDFRAFTPADTEHKTFHRTVLGAAWHGEPGGVLELRIVADAFLRHMVRTLVGTMLELEPPQIVELLSGSPRERAGKTEAACGLCLVGVAYTEDEVAALVRDVELASPLAPGPVHPDLQL